jgi:hypothetical protein
MPLIQERMSECPVCHEISVPKFSEADIVTATACQNDDCRWLIARDGKPIRQITEEEYKAK